MKCSEWKKVRLMDVVDILGDGLHGTPKYDNNGEYYFINGNNLNGKIVVNNETKKVNYDEHLKYKKNLNDRTILVSINGTLGKVALYNAEKVILGKSACYFNVSENVDKNFIKYIMISNQFNEYVQNYATGTTIKNMGLKLMREFSFCIPSLPEQRTISHILLNLDDKIELNSQINKNLQSLCQLLFKQWFVDFEFENEEGLPYKSSCGEMFNSELGMIPKGWDIKELGDLCNITSSKRIYMNEYVEAGIPFYRSKEIIQKSKGSAISTELYISLEKYNEIRSKFSVPEKGDILLTSVGTLGIPYVVDDERFYFKDGNLTWFKDYKSIEYSNYIYLWLLSDGGRASLDSITIGSTQKALTIASLKKLKLVGADDLLLKKFQSVVGNLLDEIRLKNKENESLINLRDTLLPKLMSGEIDLDNLEVNL